MSLPSRIFITGAAGSKWSTIGKAIEEIAGFNISDRSPTREYIYENFSHVGMYFGTGMEMEAEPGNVDSAHTSLEGTRLIKSHEWIYRIDNIKARFPGDYILLVKCNPSDCLRWFKFAGGLDIPYPKYRDFYKTIAGAKKEIELCDKTLEEYTAANGIDFVSATSVNLSTLLGEEVTLPEEFLLDVEIALVK